MKRIIQLLTLVSFAVPAISQAADGDAFKQNRKFTPGVYEATVDANVYFDIDRAAIEQGVVIKKGTRIYVYTAGNHSTRTPSFDWFSLSETQSCNSNLLPWDRFAWAGVMKKDFYRVGSLPKPVYRNGLVSNCEAGSADSSMGNSDSAFGASDNTAANSGAMLTIRETARVVPPEKNVTSRQAVEVTGKIEQENNAAGGNYWVNGGKGKQYTLGYLRDLDEDTQNQLNRLVKSGVSVTVKGTLKSWNDGSTSFDNSQPVYVNLLVIRESAQFGARNPGANTGNQRSIEVVGKVSFGTNAAGSNFWIDGGRGKQFILGYYRDLDEETQSQLGRLADSGAIITAKGVMRSWADGSSSFDNSQPVNLFFVVKKDSYANPGNYSNGNSNGNYQDGNAVSRRSASVTGQVVFGNNAAGGNYWINDGRGKQYTLGYVRDLDQATQDQLSRLADTGDKVTVKGTMKTWKDGTASFDNSQPISIYKTR
ncbi:MAG: hypothetical protein WAO71_13040 [Gallionella sp.]